MMMINLRTNTNHNLHTYKNLDLKCVGGTPSEIGVDHGVELDTTTVIKRTKMWFNILLQMK